MKTKINKSAKILKLLASGKDPAAVAKAVDVSVNYVYSIRWQANNKKNLKKKVAQKASNGHEAAAPEINEATTQNGLKDSSLDAAIAALEDKLSVLRTAQGHMREIAPPVEIEAPEVQTA